METELGGNRKVAFILSQRRGEHCRLMHEELCLPTPSMRSPSSVQSLGHVRLFATPRIAARQATLSITISRTSLNLPVHHQLPESTETHVHGVSDAIQPSHPLLSPSPPAPNPSQRQSLFQ